MITTIKNNLMNICCLFIAYVILPIYTTYIYCKMFIIRCYRKMFNKPSKYQLFEERLAKRIQELDNQQKSVVSEHIDEQAPHILTSCEHIDD